jgi:FMN phosphatase YigB (HAD superfamily)
LTFFGALGGVIERDLHQREVFNLVRPGIDLARERQARLAAGIDYWSFHADDLYPDAVPCLNALRAAGYLVGIAGNQTATEEEQLRAMDLPVDLIASASQFGAEKPDPAFFAGLVDSVEYDPGEIVYVGDRLDNDVLPAIAAGMIGVLLRRGPWGVLHASRPDAARAALVLDDLTQLPAALRSLSGVQ